MKNKVKLVKFAILTLRKNYEDESNDYGLLQWSIRNGYPRISIFTTSKKSDHIGFDYGTLITAPFDYITLGVLFDKFKEIIDSPVDTKHVINCYNAEFKNGEKTGKDILQSRVAIGKDKGGIVYISVVEEEKKKIKFDLLPSDRWFKFFDNTGAEITDKAELSKVYAKSYLRTLIKLMESELLKDSTNEVSLETKAKPMYVNAPKKDTNNDDMSKLFED